MIRLPGIAINHTIAKPKILAAWPDGKLDVVAALKRMETVYTSADERWIIMGPGLRPVATANVP